MVLSSPQNGLFRPLKRVFSACDMTHIVMQNGPYCDAIKAILQNQVLFTARKGGKSRLKISISAEKEVLIFGRRETEYGSRTFVPQDYAKESRAAWPCP